MTFGKREDAEKRDNRPEARVEDSGRKPREVTRGTSDSPARKDKVRTESEQLMEAVVARKNMLSAYQQVKRNRGVAGVDKMNVEQMKPHLQEHWAKIKEELLNDKYHPQPVLGVEIPKASGGVRQLGIPTVVDRMIQQAIYQVISPKFEPGFSESSYGFRPGRSAHQAVSKAREYIAEGQEWVVDLDLEKFFDRVNHDILMSRLARKISDKRVLRLIRRYLQAGLMMGGVESARVEGTPQGGPLSPLLSNILLDELDKELERRGHKFCRYADDCNIYVKTEKAGKRVMASITGFLGKRLKLKVNEKKSAVARAWERKFLGYSTTKEKDPRLKPAEATITRLRVRIREIFRKGRGRSLSRVIEELNKLLRGWMQYYRLAGVRTVFERLDGWIRRRLRCQIWRQGKRPWTRARKLILRGLEKPRAWGIVRSCRGPWSIAGLAALAEAYPKSYFTDLGLVSLADQRRRYHNFA